MSGLDNAPTYSIGELADLADVSRRTVRYYIQRGLLPVPEGAGRGSRYTQRHLDALIEIRRLQESGRPLPEIAARLEGQPWPEPAPLPISGSLSVWTRIPLADGVELHLSGRHLDGDTIRALAEALHPILNPQGAD